MYAGKRTQKWNKNKKEKKGGSGIQADYIDKQCLDRYVTWLLGKFVLIWKWLLGLTNKYKYKFMHCKYKFMHF